MTMGLSQKNLKKGKIPIAEFAKRAGRTPQHINHLVNHGNVKRKLKAVKISSKWWIPESELDAFPFISKPEHAYSKDIARINETLDGLETVVDNLIDTVAKLTVKE